MKESMTILKTVIFIFTLTIFIGPAHAEDDSLYIQPYVTNITTQSAQILWVSSGSEDHCTVHIKGPGCGYEMNSKTKPISKRSELLHVANLEKLNPYTTYTYSIKSSSTISSGEFTTSPENGEAINFVIYGDTRSRPDKHKLVSEAIALKNPMFVLCSGDFVADGSQWNSWKNEFFDPANSYLSKAAIWPARGNHENDGVYLYELFNRPRNEGYYSYNFGDLHIVVLDQFIPPNRYPEMLQWLNRDLDNDKSTWSIVCYHTPSFNIGGHGSNWGKEKFLPVLEKQGVDIVITGHSHLYERFLPISSEGNKPITYIVSGGGGAPTYEAIANPILVGGIGIQELHFCNFSIDGNKLEMQAIKHDGTVIDEFKLIKEGNRYQDEFMKLAITVDQANHFIELFEDYTADFSPAIPEINQVVEVNINAENWREGSIVHVSQSNSDSTWNISDQHMAIKNGRLVIEAVPIEKIEASLDGYNHPLYISLISEDESIFNGVEVKVNLSDAMLQMIVPDPVPVPIVYSDENKKIDADLSDWEGIPSLMLPFMKSSTSDFRFYWNESGIYGCFKTEDDSININRERLYTGDSFEMFIDKTNCRANEMNELTEQIVLAPIPENNGGEAYFQIITGVNRNKTDIGIKAAWQPVRDGYILEFFYPAKALSPVKMIEDVIIGFNFALSDDGNAIISFFSDKNIDEGYKRPLLWGAVKLSK